jgi:hypothetical protein
MWSEKLYLKLENAFPLLLWIKSWHIGAPNAVEHNQFPNMHKILQHNGKGLDLNGAANVWSLKDILALKCLFVRMKKVHSIQTDFHEV